VPSKKSALAVPRPYHHGDLRRALIDAALELVTEEQDWSFSLREVTRRAGVSHNAPYNHFGQKRDLLGAVAAVGFETLRDRLIEATAKIRATDKALRSVAQAYVGFAAGNVALYRLMFGPALVGSDGMLPAPAEVAGHQAKAVLEGIIARGARAGLFAVDADDPASLTMATLSCWSALHGLTTLVVDARVEAARPLPELVDGLMRFLLDGLHRR